MTRELLKLGNRELYGSDFSWVVGEWLQDIKRPEALMVLERREWGNFYGYLLSVKENGGGRRRRRRGRRTAEAHAAGG